MEMPMHGLRLLRILCFSGLLALAACGRETPPDAGAGSDRAGAPESTTTPAEDFERTWLGVLPCADCDGIQTRLVLRGEDGKRRYLLEETYLGAEGDNTFVQEGEWTEE